MYRIIVAALLMGVSIVTHANDICDTWGDVAQGIALNVRDKGVAEIQSVGAGATNQAIKSIAIARGYLAPSGIDIVCVPGFANVEVGGEPRTAIKLIVKSL